MTTPPFAGTTVMRVPKACVSKTSAIKVRTGNRLILRVYRLANTRRKWYCAGMEDVVCAICEEPLGNDRVSDDEGSPVHADCLRLVLGHAESHSLFKCPHCGQDSPHPRGALWDKVLASRLTCQRCGKEFMVKESV